MQILHLVHQYLPEQIGGTEFYTRALAGFQFEAGHAVSIFTPAETTAGWPEPSLEEGVRIYRHATGRRGSIERFRSTFRSQDIERAFKGVLDRERPDIVHIQHLMGLPVSLVDTLLEQGIPMVLTLHDYWYICANAQLLTNYDNTICAGPSRFLNCANCGLTRVGIRGAAIMAPTVAPIFALRNRRLSKVLNCASGLIAPTTFVRDMYGSLGAETEKIRVISHGIELPGEYPSRRKPVKNELHASYIGGLSWQKGVHVLISAFNLLPFEGSSLTIWGDLGAYPRYVSEIRRLASHPGIEFAGRLTRRRFWSNLASSDVIAVPSLWYETASLIVQEAFAAGVPVVASRIGALEERVQDGVDGLLFPPGDVNALADVLGRLRARPDLLRQLQAGIRPVRSISDHASEIEALYRETIGG